MRFGDGDNRLAEKSRELETAVVVGSDHQGGLDTLTTQSSDAPGPFPFNHGPKAQAKLSENKWWHRREIHDADIAICTRRLSAMRASICRLVLQSIQSGGCKRRILPAINHPTTCTNPSQFYVRDILSN